jgi:hypothetical protein
MRLGAKEKGLVPINCFQDKRGLIEGVCGVLNCTNLHLKKKTRPMNLMRGSSKGPRDNSSLKKKKNYTGITSQKREFLIVHNFMLRTQN